MGVDYWKMELKIQLLSISDSSSLGSRPKMVKFLSNLNISVLSVHCGRMHTLLYTNNGVI